MGKIKACQFGFTKNTKAMLFINLSETEIQRLKYERFYYPCPIVQKKRIHAIYLKATLGLSNAMIGEVVDLHRHAVSKCIKDYKAGGFEILSQFN